MEMIKRYGTKIHVYSKRRTFEFPFKVCFAFLGLVP